MAPAPKLVAPEPAKTGKKRAPENETPRDRFKRVASTRLSNTLDALRLLAAIGPSKEYEYTPADAEKMLGLIDKQLAETRAALVNRKAENKSATALFD